MSVVALILWNSLPAVAQPILHVRSETRLELRTDEDGALSGRLLDDASVGLPGQEVRLAIVEGTTRRRVVVQTDGRGEFEVALTRRRDVDIQADFDGDENFQRSSALRHLAEVPLELRFTSESRSFDLDETTHDLAVALSTHPPPHHSLVVRNELGHLVASSDEAETTAQWNVASPSLGPAGAGMLEVSLLDAEERILAAAEVRVVRFRQPSLVIEEVPVEVPIISLEGTLSDSTGPMRRRAVSVFINNERVETVLTGDEGRFEWSQELEEGSHSLYVRFDSDQVGHPSTESRTIEIVIGETWTSELWFLLPFLAFALLAIWLRATRPEPNHPLLEPVVRGVSLQIPAKTTRTKALSGKLMDLIDGSAKPGHIRAVSSTGTQREYEIASDGNFGFELEPGKWRLVFASPGHAPEILDLESPHDGRYLRMSVRVENWRHRAVRILRKAAGNILGRRDLSGTTVHQLRSEPEVSEIAADVEVLAYGAGTRDGAAIGALEEKASQIVASDDGTR